MSELNDIITKLCPDGVPYKKLGEVAEIKRGRRLTKKQLSDVELPGTFPVFHGGLQPIGYYSEKNRQANTVMITNVGASAGTVLFSERDFWSSDGCFCLSELKALNPRFAYHYLKEREHKLKQRVRVAGIPTLDADVLKRFEIPVPPLPVQAEVVRILDVFTELEAELEAELADRREQYEYYQDNLLDKKNLEKMDGTVVETKKLGDICNRQRGTRITAKQMKEIACTNGDVLIFGGGKTKVYAKKSDVPSKDIITCPSVVVKSRGNIGFEYCDVPFTHKSELWSYSSNNKAVNIKFIGYYLENNKRFFQDAANIGKLPQIATGVTDNYEIPVPSIATQERIVDILDRFDTLTTSLTDGISAEIAMRREQYEYCRSRILDFPRLPEDSDAVSD